MFQVFEIESDVVFSMCREKCFGSYNCSGWHRDVNNRIEGQAGIWSLGFAQGLNDGECSGGA